MVRKPLRNGLVPSWNLTTWEAEAGGFWMLQGQPGLHRDPVSNLQKTKATKKVPRELLREVGLVSCATGTHLQSKGQGFQGWLQVSGGVTGSGVHLLPLSLSFQFPAREERGGERRAETRLDSRGPRDSTSNYRRSGQTRPGGGNLCQGRFCSFVTATKGVKCGVTLNLRVGGA